MNNPAVVQRYDIVGSDLDHEEHPEGDWVRWEDHCRVMESLRRKHVTCEDPLSQLSFS